MEDSKDVLIDIILLDSIIKDAERYRYLKSIAMSNTAMDRYEGYHWTIGFYDPKQLGLDKAIDKELKI